MGKAYVNTEYPYVALTGKHEKILLLTPTQRKAYLELPADLRPAVSVYEHTSTVGAVAYYHVHREFVEPIPGTTDSSVRFRACRDCATSLRAHVPKAPALSIAGGVDFGKPGTIGLYDLSVLEQLSLGMYRVDMYILKLKFSPVAEAHMPAVKGHGITFLHDGPQVLADNMEENPVFPNFKAVLKGTRIIWLGPKSEADRHQRTIKNLPELRFRRDKVNSALRALKILNPLYVVHKTSPVHLPLILTFTFSCLPLSLNRYRTITIRDYTLAEYAETLKQATALIIDDNPAAVRLDAVVESDVATPSASANEGQQASAVTALAQDDEAEDNGAVIHAVGVTRRDGTGVDGLVAFNKIVDLVNETADNNPPCPGEDGAPPSITTHRIKRSAQPQNEFENNNNLIMGSFPCEFFLGVGLKSTGSVTKKVIKHLLLQYSNQAANNARLILFLQNQQLRHRAASDVSLTVKNHPEASAVFHALINSPDFRNRLRTAATTPSTSDECKQILKEVQPFLNLSGKTVCNSDCIAAQSLRLL